MKPFELLTKRGQRNRLRKLVLAALEAYDLPVRQVRFLTEHTNVHFRVDTADGRKFAARIYSQDSSLAENEAEMFWLPALGRVPGLHVITPVPRRDGRFLTCMTFPDIPGEQRLAVYEWVPGRHLADDWTPVNYEKLGRGMALMHQQAESMTLPAHIQPKKWTQVFYYPGERPVYADEAFRHLFTPEQVQVLDTAVSCLNPFLSALYQTDTPPILLHGDLHVWNVHVYKGDLYFIDFEDLLLGFPIHDVAITLFYGRSRPDYPSLCHAFQTGYSQVRPWPVTDPRHVDWLMLARTVNFINWVAQIEDDPHEYIQSRCTAVARQLNTLPP